MIRSMTAYSRKEQLTDNGLLIWELRSVNHRFSEVSLRLPEEFRAQESAIRERIGARIKRGKIDGSLRFQSAGAQEQCLEIDKVLAGKLAHVSREVDQLLYNAAPVNAFDVLRWPGVLKAPEQNTEKLAEDGMALLEVALEELLDTRQREGEKLKAMIEARCDAIESQVADIQQQLPKILSGIRERLAARLAEIQAELDPSRLEQEVVLLVSKADVEEELDRLGAHVSEVRRVLQQHEPVGRRLDFLMQELNREANTLGSKSVHLTTTGASVELKVLIEQMREQIQNIE